MASKIFFAIAWDKIHAQVNDLSQRVVSENPLVSTLSFESSA